MAEYVLNRDGGKTDELGFSHWMYALFGKGVINIRTTTSWKVTQRGAGANMSVDIAAGDGFILETGDYVYIAFSDATKNITVDTSDPSNPRIDTVVAYIDLTIVDDTDSNNPGALVFKAVAGTPAGSPSAPNDSAIQSSIGAGNPYITLANIAVAAGASNIVNANITDTRVTLSFAGKLYGGSSNTVGHTIPNVADDTVALLNATQTLVGKTLTSPIMTSPAISGTPTLTGWDNWQLISQTPNTVTASGGRFYSLVFNSVDLTSSLTPGGKLKLTRTVTAPTKCTSLNGSTQYYSKTSPNKMTFTDDFVVSAWVKIDSYQTSGVIASRYNGTSGWRFELANGQVRLIGFNGGAANASYVMSYASIPLNRWVHVAAQLDMSAFTATSTTSYTMIDGLDVTASVTRSGTNPTALIQAGDFEVGAENGSTGAISGKLAQVAVFSAKVTQATLQTYYTQGLAGNETNLASAYSFNNSIADLNTTTPNDLTAQASAVATNADSPFAGGSTGGVTEYAKILSSTFSTNTTVAVQVPNGYELPQSGGVSAVALSYADQPANWPGINRLLATRIITTSVSTNSTSPVQISGFTITLTLPANRIYRLRLYAEWVTNSSTAQINSLSIWDGVVNSGPKIGQASNGGSNTANHGSQLQVVTRPQHSGAGGSKTFNGGIVTSSGTVSIGASTTSPTYFEIEFLD